MTDHLLRVCNFFGTEAFASQVSWEGRQCYLNTPEIPWLLSNGTTGGWLQAYGNLTRLVIAGAGHMSPFDQPVSLHEMLQTWLSNDFGKPGQKCLPVNAV